MSLQYAYPHVFFKRVGNFNGAVLLLVIFKKRNENSRGSERCVVERMNEFKRAIVVPVADIETASLKIMKI